MILANLQDHFERYPCMQVDDLYKLIYQATLGAEHAVASPKSARRWLEIELAEMGEAPPEPIVDLISVDGTMTRIHLRSYLKAGGSIEVLLDAFIRTANNFRGEVDLIKKEWDRASQTCFIPASVMDAFIEKMKEQNYPAVHHSERYKSLYKPAYRVVLRELLDV
jgi:hypothetical protein